jgi:hypothetical protein
MKTKTGGGAFDPTEPFIYFIASSFGNLKALVGINEFQLIGVNEIQSNEQLKLLRQFCESGNKLFIDSGIFNLTMTHARTFNTSMDEALALAPEDIDGFDKLFKNYCRVIDALGDVCWGYTELDQGGVKNKIRMRAKLEALGYRPMPVYHPLNDGWEYFDELASQYDRFAYGNLVQASTSLRVRLMATQWERKRAYPDVWIHYLGVTASPFTLAFPANSSDSSSWNAANRWGFHRDHACTRDVGDLHKGLVPISGSENITQDNIKSLQLSAQKARILHEVHRDVQHEYTTHFS